MFLINPYIYGYSSIKSMLFDGVDEYLNVPDDASIDFDNSDSFSASAWIYLNATGVFQGIVTKRDQPSGSIDTGWLFTVDAGNKLFLRLTDYSGGQRHIRVNGTSTLSASTWYNVGFTYDGSGLASGVTMYLNGSDDTGSTLSDNLAGSILNNNPLLIGANESSGSKSALFNGYIDEVSVWDAELTSVNFSDIYNSGCPNNLNDHSANSNLVSWWKMGEEGSISSITDSKGSNDATPTNMESGDITSTTIC